MKRIRIASLAVVCLSAAMANASLTTSFAASGNVQGEVSAYASNEGGSASGSLFVLGMPGTATVLQAYLYTNDWFGNSSITATFAGNGLGASTAFAIDGGAYGYRWDVTSYITGNGSYTAAFSGGSVIYFGALAVVYSDLSLGANARVVLNDGVNELGETGGPETGSTSFAGFGAGGGALWGVTQADDTGSSGETIDFNGSTVGGPLDANLGPFASIFNLGVPTVAGTNTADVNTTGDYFGWHVAMLQGPVPEPTSMAALGLGFLAIVARRRRK